MLVQHRLEQQMVLIDWNILKSYKFCRLKYRIASFYSSRGFYKIFFERQKFFLTYNEIL